MHRLMKTWLSKPLDGIHAVRQVDAFLMNRAFSSFDSAFACKKEMPEYLVTKDLTLAYPRMAGVTMMNQMPLCFFSSRDKAVSDCTSDAETKALHYGTANCNQFVLKLLSYLTPIDPDVEWEHTPPQAFDGAPILTEQDNRGCVKFAFNPVVQGKMTNKCISMAFIRESIDLHRLLPFQVPSGQMVSNVMSKNETAPVYKRQSNMLIGAEPWESTTTMQEDYKPVWCKFCDTSDTESQFDQHEKRWIAVCNHCQGIIT